MPKSHFSISLVQRKPKAFLHFKSGVCAGQLGPHRKLILERILCASERPSDFRLQFAPRSAYGLVLPPRNAMSFVLRLVGTGNPMPFAHFRERIAAAQAAQAAVRCGGAKRAEVYSVAHESVAKAIDAVIRGEGELVEVRHAPKS
jgi:hypothetical protein